MLNLHLNSSERFLSEAICHRDVLDISRLTNLFQELGEEFCYELCEKNKITSIAYDSLSLCPSIQLPSYWKDSFLTLEARISEYMIELDRVAELLDRNDIKVVALKNSGIARSLYPILGASPMGDLDVLVRRTDFRKAHKILTDHGYIMKFRSPLEEENLDSAEQNGGAEYSVELDSGSHLWFELQWRPVAGRWIRPDQEPSSEELIERSESIDGSKVRLLSPEDNLLQVCLHTAKHTYVRSPGFRLHTDVDRIVRSSEIDWDKFVKLVILLEVKTAVFLSLALALALLRSPIPEEVMNKISPSKIKINFMINWLKKVGLFNPEDKKWNRFGYIIFVSLIYDDLLGLFKGIFPSPQEMRSKYTNSQNKPLIFLYANRLIDIIKNRILVK